MLCFCLDTVSQSLSKLSIFSSAVSALVVPLCFILLDVLCLGYFRSVGMVTHILCNVSVLTQDSDISTMAHSCNKRALGTFQRLASLGFIDFIRHGTRWSRIVLITQLLPTVSNGMHLCSVHALSLIPMFTFNSSDSTSVPASSSHDFVFAGFSTAWDCLLSLLPSAAERLLMPALSTLLQSSVGCNTAAAFRRVWAANVAAAASLSAAVDASFIASSRAANAAATVASESIGDGDRTHLGVVGAVDAQPDEMDVLEE